MTTHTATTMTINGAHLHIRDRGSGPAIVLLHGGLGAGSDWDQIAQSLSERFRVITFDSRGHGRSDNPSGQLSYALLADDTAGLISALGLRSPTVAGWSDGGQVALELASRHPARAGSIIVGGAYPEFDNSGLRAVHYKLADELRADRIDERDPEWDQLRKKHADLPRLLEQTAGMWTSYPGLDPQAIAAITLPALVLAADRDELVSLRLHLRLFDELPNAELAVLPGAHHETPFAAERASLVSASIQDFALRHPSESTSGGRP